MKGGRPTSRDIAHLAEVSQATVSRALRNSPLVAPETRARVRSIADQLRYRTDRSAAGLRTGRSGTLALLLFEDTADGAHINPFFLSMLGHLARATAARGFDLLVSFQQLSDDWHTDYQLSNRADGIILLGYGDYLASMPRLRLLADRGAHFVIWGPVVEGMPGRYVCSDNAGGARQAVRHLLSLGRRRIAFAGGASDHWPEFRLRYDGYARALRNAGLEPDPVLQADAQSSEAAGYEAACRLLDSGAGFDAVFAASDRIAFGVMGALRDRGLSVPRDVAVVGFDDIATAAHFNPPLTTVRQDTERAAELLVDNLLRRIAGERVESVLIEPTLVIRTSCGVGDAER
ncbi:MAG: LacI family transcriptional regulator [Gammaproteobacteria bacterium]|nr:LacI family transcriptional regulator [Gammaproteobacteria bacterium]